MNLFKIYLVNEFKKGWQYRMQIPMMWLSHGLVLAVQIFLWKALYGGRISVSGIEITSLLSYFIFSSFITVLLPQRLSRILGVRINTGLIAGDLLKPITIKWHLVSQVLASNIFSVAFIMLPINIAFFIFLNISVDFSLFSLLFIVPSLLMAFLIIVEFEFILGLWCFWVGSNIFISFIHGALYVLLSGMILPVYFMPVWLRTVTAFFPLRYAIFEPLNIITQFNANAAAKVLLIQCIWFVLLWILEQIILTKAQKKIFVIGG